MVFWPPSPVKYVLWSPFELLHIEIEEKKMIEVVSVYLPVSIVFSGKLDFFFNDFWCGDVVT